MSAFEPYDERELTARLEYCDARAAMRRIVDHNFALIALCEEWNEYLSEMDRRERPKISLPSALIPGRTMVNHAMNDLETVAAFYGEFEYGSTPQFEEVVDMARSTATLIACLNRIHHTFHLDEAARYFSDFVEHIEYAGPSSLSREKYAECLNEAVRGFIAACKENAHVLTVYFEKLETKCAAPAIDRESMDYLADKIVDKITERRKSEYSPIIALVREINAEIFRGRSIPKATTYVRTAQVTPQDMYYEEIIAARTTIAARAHRLAKSGSLAAIAEKEDAAWRSIRKMAQPRWKRAGC